MYMVRGDFGVRAIVQLVNNGLYKVEYGHK